tara:strand:- start:911 stop:1228 length:318 start_codon:yes stop_codon:yes gene_type:complete
MSNTKHTATEEGILDIVSSVRLNRKDAEEIIKRFNSMKSTAEAKDKRIAEQNTLINNLVFEGTQIRNRLKAVLEKGSPSVNADFIIHILKPLDKQHGIANKGASE